MPQIKLTGHEQKADLAKLLAEATRVNPYNYRNYKKDELLRDIKHYNEQHSKENEELKKLRDLRQEYSTYSFKLDQLLLKLIPEISDEDRDLLGEITEGFADIVNEMEDIGETALLALEEKESEIEKLEKDKEDLTSELEKFDNSASLTMTSEIKFYAPGLLDSQIMEAVTELMAQMRPVDLLDYLDMIKQRVNDPL